MTSGRAKRSGDELPDDALPDDALPGDALPGDVLPRGDAPTSVPAPDTSGCRDPGGAGPGGSDAESMTSGAATSGTTTSATVGYETMEPAAVGGGTGGSRMRGPDGRPSLATGLRAVMSQLTPAEKKIARAILAAYPFAGLEPIADLAFSAGVSAASVVRFARSLGFGGYREFQEALKLEMREREESNLSQAEVRTQGEGPVFDAARTAYHAGIDETFDSVIGDDLDRIVDLLTQTKRTVALVGATYTSYIADLFQAQLAPARPGVTRLSSSPLLAAAELIDFKRGGVLIALDVRRHEPSVAEVVRIGNESGLTTVVFTDLWLSPAASLADHVLTAEVRAAGPADTLAPMLALVEAVCELVADRLGTECVDRLARIDPLRLRLRSSADRL